MLDNLISLTTSREFDEYGSIHLAEMWLEGDVLNLSLNLYPGDSEDYQSWRVECVGFLEHRVSLGSCYEFALHFDHALLWSYIYPQASLSFYGAAKDPLAVVGALYERHQELAGHSVPFGNFINGNPANMIGGRFGMLADGPTPLIEGYANVLESFGIGTRITEPKPAPYTNDELSGLEEVAVLTLNEGSYVVAPKFYAHKLRE